MAGRFLFPLLVVVVVVCMVGVVINNPDTPFLVNWGGALWIVEPHGVDLQPHQEGRLVSVFRTRFRVDAPPSEAVLHVNAVGAPMVWLDNHLIWRPDAPPKTVKTALSLDVSPFLTPGFHEIHVQVDRRRGFPLLRAFCNSLKLATGENWEVGHDGRNWTKAWDAGRNLSAEISSKFPTIDKALVGLWWVFLPVFLVAFFLAVAFYREDNLGEQRRCRLSASQIRWLLIGFWGILAVNNMGKIPLYVGMDAIQHYQYIEYVWENKSIPIATEGWQMFQSPLFYLLCAPIFGLFKSLVGPVNTAFLLRATNLLCGLLLVELCYRGLRYVYPDREDLQSIGTALGGLLPMNIYISQAVGNEPMAALFAGTAVVICLRLFSAGTVPSISSCALLGLAVGLSVLTKPTAFLLIPAIFLCMAHLVFTCHGRTWESAATLGRLVTILVGVATLVSGWYYVRNYILMGHFFVGGWDPSGSTVWWQYPSYRTMQQITTFGESLYRPIYSAVHGIWDSLYSTFWADGGLSSVCAYKDRPPWNYDFMLSTLWFSLLPTAGIAIGIIQALTGTADPMRNRLFFPAMCVVTYLLAVFYLFLVLPIYSTAKATYTMGLTPCYAVLGAAGLNVLMRGRISRAIVIGLIACWAIGAYAGFFVI
jgi:hypothetical protein